MYRTPGLVPQLGLLLGFRVEKQLCADCQKDLDILKSEHIDPKLTFKGPFLIRREEGYSVASLPYCDLIIPTPSESALDWTELLSFLKDKIREGHWNALKTKQRSRAPTWLIRGFWNGPSDKDATSDGVTDAVAVFLRKAADDPSPFVRNYAIAALKKFEQEPDP